MTSAVRRVCAVVAAAALLVVGCQSPPPDCAAAVAGLTGALSGLPGVRAATHVFRDDYPKGLVYFRITVAVSDDATGDQLAGVVAAYLSDLASRGYAGFKAELDITCRGDVFAVDSGNRPIANREQILAQARAWWAVRRESPGSTLSMRATIAHPAGTLSEQEVGRSNVARLQLPDAVDYLGVIDVVEKVSTRYPELAVLHWTFAAGRLHYAEIESLKRFPDPRELDLWGRLNADQVIPHLDALRINSPMMPGVWISEQTTASRDVAVAVRLAERHLPVVAAALPAPVLYSASDELSGHIGGRGNARGPVSVTVGGCTPRDPAVYQPIPAEQALIDRYADCR